MVPVSPCLVDRLKIQRSPIGLPPAVVPAWRFPTTLPDLTYGAYHRVYCVVSVVPMFEQLAASVRFRSAPIGPPLEGQTGIVEGA